VVLDMLDTLNLLIDLVDVNRFKLLKKIIRKKL
jgi:hypothetical protein